MTGGPSAGELGDSVKFQAPGLTKSGSATRVEESKPKCCQDGFTEGGPNGMGPKNGGVPLLYRLSRGPPPILK